MVQTSPSVPETGGRRNACAPRRPATSARAVMEAVTGIKRAGADLIITYHAKDIVRWIG